MIAAAGLGNSLGTLVGSLLKARKPEGVVLVVLLADATVAILVAVFYGFPILIALGLVAGLCSSLGKLSLDAMIQRDVPETVRTSVFARSETVLQLSWVIGGGCGIVLPLIPRLGFGFLAGVLLIVVFLVIRMKPSARPATDPLKPKPSGRGGGSRTPEPAGEPEQPTSTTRTILTTSVAEQRAGRERSSRRYDEPTVELKLDDTNTPRSDHEARPDQPTGRWWSGQPDEDDEETREDQAPWSEEPTVERNPSPTIRRRRGHRPPR